MHRGLSGESDVVESVFLELNDAQENVLVLSQQILWRRIIINLKWSSTGIYFVNYTGCYLQESLF